MWVCDGVFNPNGRRSPFGLDLSHSVEVNCGRELGWEVGGLCMEGIW